MDEIEDGNKNTKNEGKWGKVLSFPSSKGSKGKSQADGTALERALFEIERQKVSQSQILAGASLAFVLIASITLNFQTDSAASPQTSKFGRTIASISKTPEQKMQNLRWEHEVARKLASAKGRQIASVGIKPTLMDSLQFGTLEGKYSVSYQGGKIKAIKLSSKNFEDGKYILNRRDFILKYKDLMPTIFSSVKLKGNVISGDTAVESYELFRQDGQKTGELNLQLDSAGRLITMEVK